MSTSVPLIDLHRHIEGSVRASTVLELAHHNGHPLAAAVDPRGELVAGGNLGDLVSYLQRVDVAIPALTSLEDWHRAAAEAVTDAFDDGLTYAEFRFAPGIISHETGLDPIAVIDAVADGATTAATRWKLPIGLIGIVVRDLGPDTADRQITDLLARKDRLCAVDLAGNESGYPAQLFTDAFTRARTAGLHITIHAGEAAGPHSVWDAIRHLGAERIGHGVRSVEDPALLDHLAEHEITLEVALTSNTQTGASPSFKGHQIHQLLAHGVPVTINTDNPRVSNTTLSREHALAISAVGLSAAQLDGIARHSQDARFDT